MARITQSTHDQLIVLAAQFKISKARLMAIAIEKYLENQDPGSLGATGVDF
jgi:hypothetical protein